MQFQIRFRELTMEDAIPLYKIYSDHDAMRFRGSKSMTSITDAMEFIKNQRKTEGESTTIRSGVELVQENKLIGTCMCRWSENTKDSCEIGYSIGRQYWGQGLGTEIVGHLLFTLQDNKDLKQVNAWSHIDNISSIKILEKNGFSLVKAASLEDGQLYTKTIR